MHELGIYLQSRRYACEAGKWEYETPLPEWALPPPGMTGPTDVTKETDPLAVVGSLEKMAMDSKGPNGQTIDQESYVAPSKPLWTMPG